MAILRTMVTTCPQCEKPVSVPDGAAPNVAVRCPLCHAEYPLSEALALLPPELIVLPSGRVEPEVAAESPVVPEADVAENHNEAAAMAESLPPAAARFRSRRHKSGLQTLIEVIVGGAAGIIVAYYGLALFYRADFHRLGLPDLPLPFMSQITGAPGPDVKRGAEKERPGRQTSATQRPRGLEKTTWWCATRWHALKGRGRSADCGTTPASPLQGVPFRSAAQFLTRPGDLHPVALETPKSGFPSPDGLGRCFRVLGTCGVGGALRSGSAAPSSGEPAFVSRSLSPIFST
ncbi:MAG: hypothetical protein ABFC96_17775 [Thermoguttaceae bacterium]